MFRKVRFITLALLAAAVAAPVGQATDPLAQSVLRGEGLSASQVKEWTTGVCSHQVKPASCYRSPAQTGDVSIANEKPVDPLAVSMLRGRNWSASRIYDWTRGACSEEIKPSSCYLTAAQARLASKRLAESMGGPRPTPSAASAVVEPGGFAWGDALIGAAVTSGVLLLGAAGALALHRRRGVAHP
jgi:hypothetical protein